MKTFWLRLVLIVSLVLGSGTVACTHQEAKQATTTTLTAVERGCIFYSTLTDADTLAKTCRVIETFLPIVRELIGAREDARRAGVLILPQEDTALPLNDGGAPSSNSDAGKGKPGDGGKP